MQDICPAARQPEPAGSAGQSNVTSRRHHHARVFMLTGPSGITVRELAKKTGTDIKSWTEPGTGPDGKDLGPIRVFFIQASAWHMLCGLAS